MTDLAALPDLLTDHEMAAYLRKTKTTIQRMRLQGGLPYIPGRPPLVSKADFLKYIESLKQTKKTEPVKKPFAEMTSTEQAIAARERAMKMKLKPVRRPRPRTQ
jgi:hypothetical protein